MSHGETYAPLRSIASHGGGFEQRINPPGDYIVALETVAVRNPRPFTCASCSIRDATQLSPERGLTYCHQFRRVFGMPDFSAIKLWRAANPRV